MNVFWVLGDSERNRRGRIEWRVAKSVSMLFVASILSPASPGVPQRYPVVSMHVWKEVICAALINICMILSGC